MRYLSKITNKHLFLEIASYYGKPQQVAEFFCMVNSQYREVFIHEYPLFKNIVVKRETFRVESLSQLLSPWILNYKLDVVIDHHSQFQQHLVRYMMVNKGLADV